MEGQGSLACATGSEIQMIDFAQGGDGGVDVWLLLYFNGEYQWIKVDAKGVWNKPVYMLIPTRDLVHRVEPLTLDPIGGRLQVGAVVANTIYVQSYRHRGQDENENNIDLGPWPINGWAWGHEVMKYPADWYKNNNRYVHMVPSWGDESVLHPMEELMAMYCDRWRIQNLRERIAIYCDNVILRGGHGGQPPHGGGRPTQEIGHVPRTT
jgi:hypothetical protein